MIRVLIERQVRDGNLEHYKDIISRAKLLAGHTTGFIAGEMLSDLEDPNRVLVISLWDDEGAWSQWKHSNDRADLNQQLSHLLRGPESIRIYA